MITYESGVYLNGFSPDKYSPDNFNDTFHAPDDSFVISRNIHGQPLSLYGNEIWDLSPYKLTIVGNSRINFCSWIKNKNRNDEANTKIFKWIIFIIIYITPNNGYDSVKSVGTIISYSVMIRHLLKKISNEEYSLKEFLESQTLINSKLNLLSKEAIRILPSLLSYFLLLGKKKTGLTPVNKNFIYSLSHYISGAQFTYDQTPVIPTRIYSSIIKVLQTNISSVLACKSMLIKFLERVQKSKTYARSPYSQRNYWKLTNKKQFDSYDTFFPDAIDEFGLTDLFNKFEIRSIVNLPSFLKLIQNLVRVQIHLYSGMRRSEVLSLKLDCLKIDTSAGKSIYYIDGVTTKLTKSKKPCRWIIGPEAVSGIELCQDIVSVIAKTHSFKSPNNFYLFSNIAHIAKANFKPQPESISNFFMAFDNNKLLKLFDCETRIDECDLEELRMLCPERNWDEEQKFQKGNAWPIATHQFRRSLAFYVAQSGLVSLPSLKQQLKHTTNYMSLYYAKGSGMQLNFFMQGNKEHFISELNKVKPVADALAFIKSILESNTLLEGTGGRYIEKYTKPRNDMNVNLISREDIIKKFRNGEIAYTETPLGACLSVKPCDKKALRAVSACIDCDKAVIKTHKLDHVIQSMEIFVQKLEPTSIEHKFENEQLQDLIRMQCKIRRRDE
ncbi:hypothetical protein J3L11_05640 [Shewanella sp. 4t3-1-2LB]|uniref:hypothetical protein n=1 Tax=Shewanella sp. 4t3-1-2LB TaxID=2817682 RepID=UPI001A99A716|nr:hypothetical protein [Shewanella sp. 4t3-1-2LB]MBO1271132.1 hypothetical protein [Shewanella sp. 4t3-1-2LB]